MMKSTRQVGRAVLLATIAVAGCSTARHRSEPVRPMSAGGAVLTPAAQAKADSGRPPYTAADVRFMQGMIRHHGQAITMAAWAQTHAARNDVRILASRIDVAQRDEIALMQRWLRDRRETAPDDHTQHAMAGHQMADSGPLMPGMLTPEQLAQLQKATGPEFDRLFLTFMIQHHEGALTMVRELFGSPGAGQDATIFRFASDVEADQTTEIDRMHTMLAPQRNQP
jgi:uncharacterized protein (DUF305 family)